MGGTGWANPLLNKILSNSTSAREANVRSGSTALSNGGKPPAPQPSPLGPGWCGLPGAAEGQKAGLVFRHLCSGAPVSLAVPDKESEQQGAGVEDLLEVLFP